MKYTTNYKFKKPEGTEPVNFDDINDSFDLIDETLRKQDDILETEYFYPTISNGVLKSNSPMLNTFSGWVNAIKYNGQSFTHARVYVNIENECDVIYSILDSNKNIIIECTKHIYHPGYCVFEFPRKITNSDITGSVFYFSIRSKAGASRIAYSILDTIKDYYYASDYPDYYYTTSTPDTLYPCDVKSKYYIKVDLIDCTSNVIIPDANDRLDLLEAKLQNIGVKGDLQTTDKSSLVNAINEVKNNQVTADNRITTDLNKHLAEKATQTTLGHVKAGKNVTIQTDGRGNGRN